MTTSKEEAVSEITISDMRTSLDWLKRHGGLESSEFTHPNEGEFRVAVDRLSEAVDRLERYENDE